jgi:hypothetical protein
MVWGLNRRSGGSSPASGASSNLEAVDCAGGSAFLRLLDPDQRQITQKAKGWFARAKGVLKRMMRP